MKNPKHIALILGCAAALLFSSRSFAQVSGTVTVTVNVVSAPAVAFVPTAIKKSPAAIVAGGSSLQPKGMTFVSSEFTAVHFKSAKSGGISFDLHRGQARTFTSAELKGVSEIRLEYLGS